MGAHLSGGRWLALQSYPTTPRGKAQKDQTVDALNRHFRERLPAVVSPAAGQKRSSPPFSPKVGARLFILVMTLLALIGLIGLLYGISTNATVGTLATSAWLVLFGILSLLWFGIRMDKPTSRSEGNPRRNVTVLRR